MKFEGLFYIFIVENDMVYVKRSIFKKLQLQPPADFGGYQTPQTVDLADIKRQPFK